jgi:signal transduction histidine kinase/CheY-like chemotaxis protein
MGHGPRDSCDLVAASQERYRTAVWIIESLHGCAFGDTRVQRPLEHRAAQGEARMKQGRMHESETLPPPDPMADSGLCPSRGEQGTAAGFELDGAASASPAPGSAAWLMSASVDPMLILDPEWVVLRANEAAAAALRLGEATLAGMRFDSICVDAERRDRLRAELMLRGALEREPALCKLPGGAELPVEISVSQLPDGSMLVVLRDTTPRKRPASPVPPASVPSSRGADLSDLVLVVDGGGSLLEPPRGNLGLLGIAAGTGVNADWHALVGAQGAALVLERVRASLALDSKLEGRIDATVGGRRVPVHAVFSPGRPGAGPPACAVSLREATGAEPDGEAVSHDGHDWQSTVSLASGIAHRFNNLLVAITGNLGIVRGSAHGDPTAQAALDDMEVAAREMAELTRNLLSYARGGRYRARPVDVREIVESAIAAVNPACYPNVRVETQLGSCPVVLEGDALQLKQVFVNLLTNALEAMGGEAGSVQIAASAPADAPVPQRARRKHQGPWVRISVRDSGCGMPEAVRARAFEPFFTTKAPGRGLGLSAADGIVRAHDGSLRIESKAGEGTTALVFLPGAPGADAAASDAVGAAAPRKRSALVVDDNAGTVRVLRRLLTQAGWEVLAAPDGKSALQLVASGARADVCILDVALPDGPGDELFPRLRYELPSARFVICSGFAETAGAVRSLLDQGADAFLQKPFDEEEVTGVVRRVLEQPKRKPG